MLAACAKVEALLLASCVYPMHPCIAACLGQKAEWYFACGEGEYDVLAILMYEQVYSCGRMSLTNMCMFSTLSNEVVNFLRR